MAGVFITKGMTIQIPAGGLVISLGGEAQSRLTLHVHYDLCPLWLKIATRHINDANDRKLARAAAWQLSDEQAKAEALERECESSMQAVMAGAIAIDSFYANVRDTVAISAEEVTRWRANNTARYKQITEVLRRAFKLKNRDAVGLREALKDIYKFRDLAVHPSGEVAAPVLHEELQVGVEWRFAIFRAANAEKLVNLARQIVCELVSKGTPANAKVERYAKGVRARLLQET
jgi:hypothetical protein